MFRKHWSSVHLTQNELQLLNDILADAHLQKETQGTLKRLPLCSRNTQWKITFGVGVMLAVPSWNPAAERNSSIRLAASRLFTGREDRTTARPFPSMAIQAKSPLATHERECGAAGGDSLTSGFFNVFVVSLPFKRVPNKLFAALSGAGVGFFNSMRPRQLISFHACWE